MKVRLPASPCLALLCLAVQEDYVLCEKIDFFTMPGSRRQQERPTPESPPAPQPLPSTLTGAHALSPCARVRRSGGSGMG